MYQKITNLLTILALSALTFMPASEIASAHHTNSLARQTQHASSQSTTTQYNITFQATWSAQTHPNDFPSSNPHFSGLVGATHNAQVTFWTEGQVASEGIESMAETGSKSKLLTEVDAAIAAGTAGQRVSGGSIGLSPGSVSMDPITVNKLHPQLTLVSMIAPSPDWFVGTDGLSLVDANGNWIDNLVV